MCSRVSLQCKTVNWDCAPLSFSHSYNKSTAVTLSLSECMGGQWRKVTIRLKGKAKWHNPALHEMSMWSFTVLLMGKLWTKVANLSLSCKVNILTECGQTAICTLLAISGWKQPCSRLGIWNRKMPLLVISSQVGMCFCWLKVAKWSLV